MQMWLKNKETKKHLNMPALKKITAAYRQSMATLAARDLLLDGQHIRDSRKQSSHLYVCVYTYIYIYIYLYSCINTSKHCRSCRLQMTKRFPNLYPFTRRCICSPYLVLFLACLRVHRERSSIQNRCTYLPTASP